MKGHQVTVYESSGRPGGMSATGIPDYRLPYGILQQEVDPLVQIGVRFHFNHTVGKDLSLVQLEESFDAVFVGIGAQNSAATGIDGEKGSSQGFFSGLDYLREINDGRDPYPDGKKVAVIGGGNVAIDCSRSALRLGKDAVHLIYRRTRDEMPADSAEIKDAQEEQVHFHFLTAPVRILSKDGKVTGLECVRMELGEPDESGRPRPVPKKDSGFVFECDTVVSAIGQQVEVDLLHDIGEIKTTAKKTIEVDEFTKQSPRPKLFFAGDCETGPDSLVAACAGGRKAAISIDLLINGRVPEHDDEDHFDLFFRSAPVFDPDEKIGRVENKPRLHPKMLPLEKRKPGFEEVEQCFTAQEAVAEAERCLRCYQVATLAL